MTTLLSALILSDILLLLLTISGYFLFFGKKKHTFDEKKSNKLDLSREIGRQQLEQLRKYNISLPISAI